MRRQADMQEVARRAGVSTATVSRVMNYSSAVREETAARVRRAISELHYVPNSHARSLRAGRSRLFGLIVSDIRNPFFADLIDSFEELAAARGSALIFAHTNYSRERLGLCVQRLMERNVDGIAVMTSEVHEEALCAAARSHVPLVLLNQPALAATYSTVEVGYSEGFRDAVEHLKQLGHSQIGFIAGRAELSSSCRRSDAFRKAMRRCGLPVRKEWVVAGNLRVEGGEAAMQVMLALKSRPTAVIATNDLMAVGALRAARAAGLRVPRQLSIIGFDDLPVATMLQPPLTTLQLSRESIAQEAFTRLLALGTSSADGAARPLILPRLVVRGSTAAPRAAEKSS